jgi:serine/threonine protein kinase
MSSSAVAVDNVPAPRGLKTCWGTLGRALGSGTYGSVHVLVDEKGIEKNIVVKIISSEGWDMETFMESTKRELFALCQLKSTGTVTELLGHRTFGDSLALPKELHLYMKRYDSTLNAVINDSRYKTKVQLSAKLRIMTQLAEALNTCHAFDIVHRDIKCDNIMVSGAIGDMEHVKVVLGDFGLSKTLFPSEIERLLDLSPSIKKTKKLKDSPVLLSDECYTVTYRPIELLRKSTKELSKTVMHPAQDVWALGCVFLKVIAGINPFPFRSGMTTEQQEISQYYRLRCFLYFLLNRDEYSFEKLEVSAEKDLSGFLTRLRKRPAFDDAYRALITSRRFTVAKAAGLDKKEQWIFAPGRDDDIKCIVERLETIDPICIELMLIAEEMVYIKDGLEKMYSQTRTFCDTFYKSCRLLIIFDLVCDMLSPVPENRPTCEKVVSVLKNSQNLL